MPAIAAQWLEQLLAALQSWSAGRWATGRVARRCGCVLALIGLVAMDLGPRGAPAAAQTPPAASAPENPLAFSASRSATLDALFAALGKAGDDDAAREIVPEIWRAWSLSGRAEIDTLMMQAGVAMAQRHIALASNLLDDVIALAPDFAEGWNQRATLRWMIGDHPGSQADIDKVLALEPRHFGALAGRAMMFIEAERFSEALAVYRQALAVNPFLAERHQVIPMLEKKIEQKL